MNGAEPKRTSVKLITVFFTLLLSFATGCMKPVQQSDLIGTFFMRSGWACGRLSLNADHTFHQDLFSKCGPKAATVDGKWKVYIDGDSVGTISLTPFLSKGERDEIKSFDYSDLTVNRLRWRPVRIVIDPDAGTSYDKQ